MTPSINVFRESVRLESSTRVAIDRFIYWVAYDRIVVYDGVFQSKHAPQDISISELNESLVVSAYTNEVNDGLVYGIWMMGEEGGVMTSFKKLFTINIPDLSTMTLLGFRKNGEPIMESTKYEELAHINNFGINGETSSFFVCPYIETLLIDHSDGCIISNDGYGVWCGARNDKF
ncbi:hypothetical protein Tco_1300155 [Tanacetum coccineum]